MRKEWILAAAALCLQACSTTTHKLSENGQVGGAVGEASIDYGNEFGNIALEVQVKNLPPPSQAAPDSTMYVVWVRPSQALPNEPPKEGFPITNVGALRLESGAKGASSKLKSRLFTLISKFL